MISGKVKCELTMESVLQRCSPLDIFNFYVPDKQWRLNEVMCSPLRKDNNPSFIIGNKYGEVKFYDFSNDLHRGDAFKFVQIMFNLPNLDAVLRKIDSDLQLGISDGKTSEVKRIVYENTQEISKRNTLIQIVTRKFTKEELQYWNQYHQDLKDLKENNIFSIKKMFLNKKLFHIDNYEIRFGYFYPDGGYWKVYFPFREKRKKWVGNVPLQTSWGIENLKKECNSLITKSLKDYMVCRKIISCVTGVQNESTNAFSQEFVKTVKENSNIVYYGGDSDSPGKQASYKITESFGFKHINPPDRLLPEYKDMADWAKKEGLKPLEEHFKLKGLIC